QSQACPEHWPARNAWTLRFLCRRARWSLARIIEEELIAVGIIDHHKPIAPRSLPHRSAPGLEFRTQRIQCSHHRLPFQVQRDEDQPLANLLRPRIGEDN